jgi:hypothetical protein
VSLIVGQATKPDRKKPIMAEVEERIARLQQLLASPGDTECDQAVLTHTLRNLQQLRAEMLLSPAD